MNIAAGAEKRLGDLGALVRAFHVEDEKAVRWPLSRPKYVASGLNFSMKAGIAFCSAPDFSASLPWLWCMDTLTPSREVIVLEAR